MNLSLRAKVGLALAAILGSMLFLVVVDLGVNAGRIHYGVSVAGVDVGGLTRVEATDPLRSRGREIERIDILLTAAGLNVPIEPRCLGWDSDRALRATIRRAYEVGRKDAPFGALSDRVAAWLWGMKVDFAARLDGDLLRRYFDAWGERLDALGEPLDKFALRRILKDAIGSGDTGPYVFPRTTTGETSARPRVIAAPRSRPAFRTVTSPLRSLQEVPTGCPDPEAEVAP